MATATRPKEDRAKAAKPQEKDAKAKEKEKAAKAKAKEQAAKAKEKEKAAKEKEKQKAAKAKEKERAAKAQEKKRAAKAQEKEKEKAAKAKNTGKGRSPKTEAKAGPRGGAGTGPKGRGGSTGPTGSAPARDGSPKPTVHASGWIAEELGKASAVSRSTKRPTLAASFTTRDHDIIQRWAQSRGGVPADVRGTGGGSGGSGAGVLRVEFRDEADRLEDVSWDEFFATFDDSDVDFLYQEFTRDGGVSRFHKIIRGGA